MSKLKISFNISSLVACENEKKGCLFDLFLHTSPVLSMLAWFLYFKITLRIGSETFSNRESLWGLNPGILRFFSVSKERVQRFCNFVIFRNYFLIFIICSFETILSERKGFTVFQKILLSLTSFSFKLL